MWSVLLFPQWTRLPYMKQLRSCWTLIMSFCHEKKNPDKDLKRIQEQFSFDRWQQFCLKTFMCLRKKCNKWFLCELYSQLSLYTKIWKIATEIGAISKLICQKMCVIKKKHEKVVTMVIERRGKILCWNADQTPQPHAYLTRFPVYLWQRTRRTRLYFFRCNITCREYCVWGM